MNRVTVVPNTAFMLGPVRVTDTVVTTWIVMALMVLLGWLLKRRLSLRPSLAQEVVEALLEATEKNGPGGAPHRPVAGIAGGRHPLADDRVR